MNNDEELTRKANEEIMEQMEAQKQADQLPPLTPQERELNPPGRTNKDFLDCTLNSVMTHNMRQLEKNYNKSQSKLSDMEKATASSSSDEMSRRQGREGQNTKGIIPGKRKKSNSSRSTSRSSRSSSSASNTERKKKLKKKKNRNKKRLRLNSSSSSCCSDKLYPPTCQGKIVEKTDVAKTGKKLKRIKSCDKDKSEEKTSETDSFEKKKIVVAKEITFISSESDDGHITISSATSTSYISSPSSGTEADKSEEETQAKTTEKSQILEYMKKDRFATLKRYGYNMHLGNENETSTDTGLDANDLTSSCNEDKEDKSPPKTDDNKSQLIIHEIEGIESLAKAEQEELPNEEKALAAKSISSEDVKM